MIFTILSVSSYLRILLYIVGRQFIEQKERDSMLYPLHLISPAYPNVKPSVKR